MYQIIFALACGALVAFFFYFGREKAGGWGVPLALARTVGLAALILLFLNPRHLGRTTGGAPTVLLDASLSMGSATGGWDRALDTALALAGADGTILRFGSGVGLFDSLPPEDGSSILRDALVAGIAAGGPSVIVTDGEVADAPAIAQNLIGRAGVVRMSRDTLRDAALVDVAAPAFVGTGDSVRVQLTVGAWGGLDAVRGTLLVLVGSEVLDSLGVDLPGAPGAVRRTITLAPRLLPPGMNAVTFALRVPGDEEPRNDERIRIITVSEDPAIVVLVDPADWEGRFLAREVAAVASTSVRSFARVQEDRWIDMRTSTRVSGAAVAAAVRSAALLIERGAENAAPVGRPAWRWPAGADTALQLFEGDWYAAAPNAASPIAGRLAGVRWDSLPPLTGVIPLVSTASEWTALTARQGRRGAERPVVMGRDSAGVREMTTVGAGLWRWAFRGGAPLVAYRAVVSAGIEWLLGSDVLLRRAPLAASPVVKRGQYVMFEWRTDSIPAQIEVSLTSADSSWVATVALDAGGAGRYLLAPGVYNWASSYSADSRGLIAVESYSDEFVPQEVTLEPTERAIGETLVEGSLRDRWWLFLVAVAAFAVEWAVRQRRGLP